MSAYTHILVVDDDTRLRELLRSYLSAQGFLVTTASDTKEAETLRQLFRFDLMVLDVMMPGETGIEYAQRLRNSPDIPPVLILSALGESANRIEGLIAGADDYLRKPFEPEELVLRIQAILRRAQPAPSVAKTLQFGAFTFSIDPPLLLREGVGVHLTSAELTLLAILAGRAGEAISREELAELSQQKGNERSIDVQINRLRKKIEENEGKPIYIQTVRGAGYRLTPSAKGVAR